MESICERLKIKDGVKRYGKNLYKFQNDEEVFVEVIKCVQMNKKEIEKYVEEPRNYFKLRDIKARIDCGGNYSTRKSMQGGILIKMKQMRKIWDRI